MENQEPILKLLGEMNSKLELIPPLSDSVAAITAQLIDLKEQLETHKTVNEAVSRELCLVNKKLVESNRKMNLLEAEMKRSNIMLFNFQPRRDPANSSLKAELMDYLNWRLPALQLTRSDVRDVFRLRTGPVVLKLNSTDTRNYILKNAQELKRDGVGVAPDYTSAEREARNRLKPVMNKAISEGRSVRLRGTKLIIDERVFIFDGQVVTEMPENRGVPQHQPRLPGYELRASAPRTNTDMATDSETQMVSADEADDESDRNSSTNTVVANPQPQIPQNPPPKLNEASENATNGNNASRGTHRKIGEIISPDDRFRSDSRNTRQMTTTEEERTRGRRVRSYQRGGHRQNYGNQDYYRLSFPPLSNHTHDPFTLNDERSDSVSSS